MTKMPERENEFVKVPTGLCQAVCVDAIYLGFEEREYNGEVKVQEKERLVFETEHDHPRFAGGILISKKYTLSSFEKAKLMEHIASWEGRVLTQDERDAVDTEELIGKPCTLNVIAVQGEKGVYHVIDSVLPPDKKFPMQPTGHYVRKKDRPGEEAQPEPEPFVLEPDDELPF